MDEKNQTKTSAGFTLVELVMGFAVLVVIGTLVGLGLQNMHSHKISSMFDRNGYTISPESVEPVESLAAGQSAAVSLVAKNSGETYDCSVTFLGASNVPVPVGGTGAFSGTTRKKVSQYKVLCGDDVSFVVSR